MYNSITEKFCRAPDPRIKYIECSFIYHLKYQKEALMFVTISYLAL